MFIELTDHLRCPAAHDEAYLVLLPSLVEGRQVLEGILGCPVCQAEYPVREGIARFGVPLASSPASLPAEAAHAFLGLSGPGGFVLLVGGAGALASGLGGLLPGTRLVLVNPPGGIDPGTSASVLHAPRLPVKTASMRGVVISGEHAGAPGWLRDAVESVLPGLRVVGEGPAPEDAGVEVTAEGAGWWVGVRGKG